MTIALINDRSRCSGRAMGSGWVCPERQSCKRYLAFASSFINPVTVYGVAAPNCQNKIEVER